MSNEVALCQYGIWALVFSVASFEAQVKRQVIPARVLQETLGAERYKCISLFPST